MEGGEDASEEASVDAAAGTATESLPYALIGAGPAGLAAARNLARRGIPFVGFERHSDVGGLWDIDSPTSTMYESAHLISSKTTTAYDEFPMRDEVPDYPSHWQMRTYFRDYADTFDLRRHYRFGTTVVRAEPSGGPEAGTPAETWQVTVEDSSGGRTTAGYRGLIIANGILSEPSMPAFEGEFEGEVMHTSAYKRPDIFRDKRVLIIGAGNSGCDIAVDAVHYARSVDMSMRSGYWFFPKYILGKPSDTLNEGPTLPAFLKTRVDGRMIRLITGNPARLGFPEPDGRIYETHPVMNTLVLYHAGHGDIKVRKDIEGFDGPAVRFRDGSSHEYDMVMLATGYRLHYPFIDPEHLNWQGNHPDLYLNIFTPKHRNLFVLGMVEATGLGWQGRYNQADLVAEFIDAQQRRPAQAEQMWNRVNGPRPDLFAGYNYRQLDRLPYYVNKDAYREAIRDHLRLFRDVG
jgi:cation diffusion facilitator CzcD-associated flavoprotein CzcO